MHIVKSTPQLALRRASTARLINAFLAQSGEQSYRVSQLTHALGYSAHILAPALRTLGWQRIQVWDRTPDGRRRLSVLWTPPGIPPIKAKRGRPEHDQDAMLVRMVRG